jgi:transposase-like protein
MQELVQWALEAEVTELLGRARYQRRAGVDGVPGYRNGYGKPRKLTTPLGTVTLRRPRVRGLEERFCSRILPLFARRTKEVGELLPELYLHELSRGGL